MKKILLIGLFSLSSIIVYGQSIQKMQVKGAEDLKALFVASSTSQYNPMDALGLMVFLVQLSPEGIYNYETAGLTWEDMSNAIGGNPDFAIDKFNKNYPRCKWVQINNSQKTLTEFDIFLTSRNPFFGTFEGGYFINLVRFQSSYNKLSNLVFNNPNLEFLDCDHNIVTKLDITNCTKLKHLQCRDNRLQELNITKNINLEFLDCMSNSLTNLNTTLNPKLETLYCYWNKINEIDVTKNINLKDLSVHSNRIKNIDLTQNNKLERLNFRSNEITEINLVNNINLYELYCHSNKLTKIDLSKNVKLESVYSNNNQLKFSTIDYSVLPVKAYFSPQAKIQGGTKGYFDLIDLSSEYNIKGNITSYEWYDKSTNAEVAVFASKGAFYASNMNAGKTLLCKMTNSAFPDLILEYEVTISKNAAESLTRQILGIPQEFKLTRGEFKINSDELSISPNPVVNTFNIDTSLSIQAVSIFNYSGKQVKEVGLQGIKQVNVQELAPGIYFIKVTNTDGNVITRKIIKK